MQFQRIIDEEIKPLYSLLMIIINEYVSIDAYFFEIFL